MHLNVLLSRFIRIIFLTLLLVAASDPALAKKEPNPILSLKKERVFRPEFQHSILRVNEIQWPLVYPEKYKIAGKIAVQNAKERSLSPSFGAAFELMWEQTLFYGLAYEFGMYPGLDSLKGGKMHRFGLNTGIMIQLDDYEKHHLLVLLRPGLSMVRSESGHASRFGLGLGIGYEYSLNSDYILCPEIVFHKYPQGNGIRPGFSNWSFGLRLSFGK